jgi:hypothetical protein
MNALIENLKAEFDASRPEPERIKQLMSDYISAGHEDYKVRRTTFLPRCARNC